MLLRTPKRLESAIASAWARDLHIVPLECDVRSSASVVEAIAYIRERSGSIDVLIYNAFAPSAGRASSLDPDRMLSEFHVNVAGALPFVNGVIDEMKTKRSGTILFSGCGLAHSPSPEMASLSVSKAALRVLIECIAQEVEPYGIRIGTVTINGVISTSAADLEPIAELYWQLFVSSERDRRRELRFTGTLAVH
jgi:NAD(P)-dependent dehydrogenase (short-subunit alcohol dehydrogenase family)